MLILVIKSFQVGIGCFNLRKVALHRLSFILFGVVSYLVSVSAYSQQSPWGVAPSHTSSKNIHTWSSEMRDIGVTSIRGFRESLGDKLLNEQIQKGFEVTGILQWSSDDNPSSFPVNDIAGWEEYIEERLQRYRGKIRHWEVWNEPPNFTRDKTPESYAKILVSAYDMAKTVDPEFRIGMSVKSTDINFLSQVLDSGARNKYDFITLHPYEVAGTIDLGYDSLYMNIVPGLRKMLKNKNPEKMNVPVRFTEIATVLDDSLSIEESESKQATELIKLYTMGLAQGVERIHWFEPIDSENLKLGLLTSEGERRTNMLAYKNLISLLGRYPSYLGWLKPTDTTIGFLFGRSSSHELVLIVWSEKNTISGLEVHDDSFQVYDFFAEEMRKQPIGSIVVSSRPLALILHIDSSMAKKWQMLAMDNKKKRFLWDGTDYSNYNEISITAGKEPKGIHFVSRPTLINTNEGYEFDLSDKPGVSLSIDPTFFTETTANYELEVVLKASSYENHPPGFNVKFAKYSNSTLEPLEGSNTGWNFVRKVEWHNKVWLIKCLSAFSDFGFQISLNSDATQYSKYRVQEIRLKRSLISNEICI